MILPLAFITAVWSSGVDFDEKCDTYSRALLDAGYYTKLYNQAENRRNGKSESESSDNAE